MQVWSRSRESLEQKGTDLSKISCSARWGQGEKESSELKSPQMTPQTQQTQDPGSHVPLPDPEVTPHPSPALGSSRSIQYPFSSAAALPTSWSTVCCPHPTRTGCRNSLCSQQTTPGLSAKSQVTSWSVPLVSVPAGQEALSRYSKVIRKYLIPVQIQAGHFACLQLPCGMAHVDSRQAQVPTLTIQGEEHMNP